MKSNFLNQIFQETCVRIIQKQRELDLLHLESIAKKRPCVSLVSAFQNKTHPVLAEMKRRSPSRGDLFPDADAVGIAAQYIASGAAAISVLTEPVHFGGKLEDLIRIRAKFPSVPLLMKDFVLNEIQIAEGIAAGADVVLLMVSLLSPERLRDLLVYTENRGASAIVEVHDEIELEIACKAGSSIIGVNNRDLRTLAVSLQTSRDLIGRIPKNVFAICESGLTTTQEIQEMFGLGFGACLIGTGLMKDRDPGTALRTLLSGGNS